MSAGIVSRLLRSPGLWPPQTSQPILVDILESRVDFANRAELFETHGEAQ